MGEGDVMFTFGHLSGINQQDMEQVVREIAVELKTPLDTLAIALKLGDPTVADKIRGAMGMNVHKELDEIIDTLPKMKVKEVEDEQQKILNLVKKMETEGQITINQSGDSTGDTWGPVESSPVQEIDEVEASPGWSPRWPLSREKVNLFYDSLPAIVYPDIVPLKSIVKTLIGLGDRSRRDGILSIKPQITEIDDFALRQFLQMAVDGRNIETIRQQAEKMARIKVSQLSEYFEVITEGVVMIASSETPPVMRAQLSCWAGTGIFSEEPFAISAENYNPQSDSNSIVYSSRPPLGLIAVGLIEMGAAARRGGILSIEPMIERIKDPALSAFLQMAIDGRDAETIRQRAEKTAEIKGRQLSEYFEIITEGVLMIGNSETPEVIRQYLSYWVGEIDG